MAEPSKKHTEVLDVKFENLAFATDLLIEKLQEAPQNPLILIQEIYAVPRGGIIPAALLQYECELLAGCNITSKRVDQLSIDEHMRLSSMKSSLLIVDDIIDTGLTYALMKAHFPDAVFVAPYLKPSPMLTPLLNFRYYGVEVPQSTWVQFPWEPKG